MLQNVVQAIKDIEKSIIIDNKFIDSYDAISVTIFDIFNDKSFNVDYLSIPYDRNVVYLKKNPEMCGLKVLIKKIFDILDKTRLDIDIIISELNQDIENSINSYNEYVSIKNKQSTFVTEQITSTNDDDSIDNDDDDLDEETFRQTTEVKFNNNDQHMNPLNNNIEYSSQELENKLKKRLKIQLQSIYDKCEYLIEAKLEIYNILRNIKSQYQKAIVALAIENKVMLAKERVDIIVKFHFFLLLTDTLFVNEKVS
jgi:hypothetical protein